MGTQHYGSNIRYGALGCGINSSGICATKQWARRLIRTSRSGVWNSLRVIAPFVGATIIAGSAFATEGAPPPNGLPDDAEVLQSAPNVRALFAPSVRLGGVEIVLEETLLTAIRDSIGVGQIAHLGDAGSSLYWLCYTNDRPALPYRIWLSRGALHGSGEVNAVTAELLGENRAPTADCPLLPASFTSITVPDEDDSCEPAVLIFITHGTASYSSCKG